MSERTLMKDGLGEAAMDRIASGLVQVFEGFDRKRFVSEGLDGIEALELKERVHHIIAVLHKYLPESFDETAKGLSALPEVWDRGDPDDPIRGFAMWPITDYVAEHGLESPEVALGLLEKLTPLFSAEFAIRPFIERHPETTFAALEKWLEHEDEHCRRLVSEGTRPKLPWGIQLKGFVKDPSPLFPLLEALRLDSSEYVRRSVANNLNDISKDHPDKLVKLCKRWQKQDKGKTDWIIRHATRSLVKAGHPGVFTLLGYTESPNVKIDEFSLPKQVAIGEALEIAFAVTSQAKAQRFVLDYAIHFVKANGKTAPKVFKIKNCDLDNHQVLNITKSHSLKLITTRKYYPGEHVLAIHINGEEVARKTFDVQPQKK